MTIALVTALGIVIGGAFGVAFVFATTTTSKPEKSEDDELFDAALDGICGKCGSTELRKASEGIVCSRCYRTFAYTKAYLARLVQEHRLKKVIEDKP